MLLIFFSESVCLNASNTRKFRKPYTYSALNCDYYKEIKYKCLFICKLKTYLIININRCKTLLDRLCINPVSSLLVNLVSRYNITNISCQILI